ncbi:aminotriazole resistance protein [Macrophomina phaseolina]|uniref:Aminotriazole resistance protein n=1 Tax=Macrophomina phaseolina TaxID=35725 RepID=A0ABQ8G8K6_9PEZI|nr:aminotriazole resistance protein [Macrophomina phaseolina]
MPEAPAIMELQPRSSDASGLPAAKLPAAAESTTQSSPNASDAPPHQDTGLSALRAGIIAAAVTGILVASSMTTGLLTVALPKMATDLDIPEHLLLWPASIYGLACGCTLLMAGSIADAVGSRIVYLIGCLLLSLSMLASGLAQTSTQLIVFRGFQGVAASCCLPTAVSILSEAFPDGRRRNIGFAMMGAGQPLGYSLGLSLGGVFVNSIGWRVSWYLCAGLALLVFVASIWALPIKPSTDALTRRAFLQRLDIIGALIASACLGMLSYVLAVVSEGSSEIKDGKNIALLCISGALIPTFIFWMDFRVKKNKTALIPNKLWRKSAFSTVCGMVFLTWAALNATNYYSSLYFQEIQELSALQTSIRFLPNAILGIILSVATGLILHKFSAYWIVLLASVITAVSPALLALNDPDWSYWYTQFWAILLSAIAVDVLFVVSNLIITNIFPPSMHALAGAVFNTVSQFGTAVGLAIMGVISSNVTNHSGSLDKTSPSALLDGYRASFWACFGSLCLSIAIGCFGLKDVGKLGLKVE